MVKMRFEDLNRVEMGAIGWTLSMLETVATETKIAVLLR